MLHHMLRAAAGNRGLWTPDNISTQMWLDASDASTITISTGVSAWADKSGNGRNATQSTSSYQPAVSSAAIGGLDAILFDGTNDVLAHPVFTPSETGIFIVAKLNSTSNRHHFLRQGDIDWTWIMRSESDGTMSSYFKVSGTTSGPGSSSTLTTNPFIVAQTFDGTSHKATIDGGIFFSSSISGTLSSPDGAGGSIGNRPGASIEYLDGLIGEIVITSDAIADADRQKMEGYLAHKWGLEANLPSAHPYKTSAP